MQVFLPYPDLKKSVCCLDDKRLGNQVYRECLTLLRGGWKNHPVAKMWACHHRQLAMYAMFGIHELQRRGMNMTGRKWVIEIYNFYENNYFAKKPQFLGNDRLHSSHRAALLAKNYAWYSQFGWKESPKIDYFWPKIT